MDDYNSENVNLIIRGKRSKQRIAYLGDGAVAALTDWLKIRGESARPLFLSVRRVEIYDMDAGLRRNQSIIC